MEEKTFGERLKTYRKAKGYTQQELAEKIGVSDKTVSRWESDGGYPDVPTLVPLARALGVTVDELLGGKRSPEMTHTEWQKLLPAAFAIGAGVLYFPLSGVLPLPLCYAAYVGCLIYGVRLQKEEKRQNTWFLVGEGLVNLMANLSLAGWCVWLGLVLRLLLTLLNTGEVLSDLIWLRSAMQNPAAWGVGSLFLMVLLALALTALTQYLVVKKGFGGELPFPLTVLRFAWGWPKPGRTLPALIPVFAGLYWLPRLWQAIAQTAPRLVEHQQTGFFVWLFLLWLLCTVFLWRKGERRYLLFAGLLAVFCAGMLGLRDCLWMMERTTGDIYPWRAGSVAGGRFVALSQGTWGTFLAAVVLAALWLLITGLRAEEKEGGD
ncbi:MAG: helix-turn-helix transcriptional regulator [Oscillospiraceae bacterium]|nr:helix-turn-helix transcriptional regulator [Oscillospiraceae bacterium]